MDSNQITKQIKFAVVMYGGGSLAIYINGVAQELLKMVQATSPKVKDLTGTSNVYRKIALLLSDPAKCGEVQDLEKEIAILVASGADPDKLKEKQDKRKELLKDVSVSFVIDVLTGSSAGGINAVFLSKALVSGANMDDLFNLWMTQGDFRILLNDKKSVRDNSLQAPREPKSLLNSQRMYLELLKALHGMDGQPKSGPMVDLLDLFVTFTDFRGVPLPLSLRDERVLERRHKQVFNFRYDREEFIDDFVKENNPFLAFAARATSAFPLAFEPMKLTDIDEVLDVSGLGYTGNSDSSKWKSYFREVVGEDGNPLEWKDRSFVDGGALDNKPFSYAIDTLVKREATGVVERKLLFIDPSPEEFKSKDPTDKPNALENLLGQGIGLPHYETIREDMERVISRNELIERSNRLIRAATEVAEEASEKIKNLDALKVNKILKKFKELKWADLGLNEVAQGKGTAFLPYIHLRISAVTDDISRLVTRYFKMDQNSDYARAIRGIVAGWREDNYKANKPIPFDPKGDIKTYLAEKDTETFLKFIWKYDVEFRLRRLRFLMQKAESLLREDVFSRLEKALSPENIEKKIRHAKNAIAAKKGVLSLDTVLVNSLPGKDRYESYVLIKNNKAEFTQVVMYFQTELNRIYLQLQRDRNFLTSGLKSEDFIKQRRAVAEQEKKKWDDEQKLKPKNERENEASAPHQRIFDEITRLEKLIKNLENLKGNLGKLKPKKDKENSIDSETSSGNSKTGTLEALKIICDQMNRDANNETPESLRERCDLKTIRSLFEGDCLEFKTALNEAAEALSSHYNEDSNFSLRKVSEETTKLLVDPYKTDKTKEFVRKFLWTYYELYESYDQISYPIFFGTPGGETVTVDMVRISSRDATTLIDEGKFGETRRKLAGDYLYAFGAFLDARWRQNDIMWGRLDGAERLIDTLLPKEKYKTKKKAEIRAALIREAQETILNETLFREARNTFFSEAVVKALTYAGVETVDKQNTGDRLFEALTQDQIKSSLTEVLKQRLNSGSICDEIAARYEVDRVLEPQPTLQIISRATQIGGKIIEDIADAQAQAGNRLRWIARLGSIFWGLVTVAAPSSLANLLFNYWLQLIYLFEVVVIVGATMLANQPVQQFGILALVLTVVLHLTVLTLHDVMRGDSFLRLLLAFLVILAAIAAAVGAIFIYAFVFDPIAWGYLIGWRSDLEKNHWGPYSQLFFIAFVGIFVLALLGWRSARKLTIRPLGWVILFFTLGMIGSGWAMENAVRTLPHNPSPILALEFANTREQVKDIIAPGTQDTAQTTAAIENIRAALFVDSIVFIPLYTLTFLLLAQLLAFRRVPNWFGKKTFFFLLEVKKWRKYTDEKENKGIGSEKPVQNVASPDEEKLSRLDKAVAFLIFNIQKTWHYFFDKKEYNDTKKFKVVNVPRWFQRNSVWLAWIAVFIILGAAAADGVENYLSFFVLTPDLDQLSLNWLAWKTYAAYIKFALIFTGVLILLLNLLRGFTHRWFLLLFVLSSLPPIFGLVLLALGHASIMGYMSVVLRLFIVTELVIAVVMIILDKKFREDF